MKLLVVEDAPRLAKALVKGFGEEGFSVDHAADGESGLALASGERYDAIVLDRMLPKLDGLTVLSRLREQGVDTPVLLLTALGELHDRVAGLDRGADDYLVKPFAFAELLARVRALVRRKYARTSNVVVVGPLRLDLGARTASVGEHDLGLTAKEMELLELLALSPGQTFSRSSIMERLYAGDDDKDSNVIDVFIARLRKKLDAAGLAAAALIETRRGAGYRLTVDGDHGGSDHVTGGPDDEATR